MAQTKSSSSSLSSQTSAAVRNYLIVYNLVSLFAWSYLFFHYLGQLKLAVVVPASWKLAGSTLNVSFFTNVYSRLYYREALEAVRLLLPIVQTVAVLEVLHAGLKWTRSSVSTAVMQVSSRLFVVWSVLFWLSPMSPAIAKSPAVASLMICWSVTEMVRYGYYADTLVGSKSGEVSPYWLVWSRYSLFWVLYPCGVASEVALVSKALPVVAQIHPVLYYLFIAVIVSYGPGFVKLFVHMSAQRKKVLGSAVQPAAAATKSPASKRGGAKTVASPAASPRTPAKKTKSTESLEASVTRSSPRRRAAAKKSE